MQDEKRGVRIIHWFRPGRTVVGIAELEHTREGQFLRKVGAPGAGHAV